MWIRKRSASVGLRFSLKWIIFKNSPGVGGMKLRICAFFAPSIIGIGLYGKSLENRILMVGFTLRRKKVRIITARPASSKERIIYEN